VIIDAPGYGYADRDKKTIISWRRLLENYVKESRHTHKVLSLVDGKVGLTEADLSLIGFMTGLRKKVTIVLTKCDKSTPESVYGEVAKIERALNDRQFIDEYVFLTSG